MPQVQSANAAKDQLEEVIRSLKLEQRKLNAEVQRLRTNAAAGSSEDATKLRNFRRSLGNALESIDVMAPVMDEQQLLEVVQKSAEAVKKVKELETEKRALQRSSESFETETRGKIALLNSDNDQLKRKLRDVSEQVLEAWCNGHQRL